MFTPVSKMFSLGLAYLLWPSLAEVIIYVLYKVAKIWVIIDKKM